MHRVAVYAAAFAALTSPAAAQGLVMVKDAWAQSDPAAIIVRSLGLKPGDTRAYSITAPWRLLTGNTALCVRLDVPDGAGGFAATQDFSMYEIADGRIVGMVKDNTLFGCPNRSYSPLYRPR